MKISIDRMIALMGALREILAIIVPLLKKKENGTDKDDLWNPYVWREMSAEAMCNIFLKEQGCVIYD